MHAVIRTGGKQYKVTEGQLLKIEKLDVDQGGKVEFDQVLLVANGDQFKVGAPYVKGAKVIAEVMEQGRRDKIRVIHFRRRKHSMKKMGHRQAFTLVKIGSISA